MSQVNLSHGDKPVDPTPVIDPSTVKEGPNGEVLIDTTVSEQTPTERPSWLPEKFKTPEDLAKSYAELEKKLGTPKEPEKTPEAPAPVDTQKVITDAGLDLNSVAAEIARDGKMSEDTIKKLEAKGIKREQAELHVEGLRAIADKFKADIAAPVGGVEEYGKMLEWAKTNVDAADLAGFDKAIMSGDPALAKMAVRGLAAQYADAVGSEPTLVTGEGVPHNAGVKPYESTEQITKDMKSREYKTDPAFRRKVEARLAVTEL